MCAYELAKNPDIQEELIQEIDEVRSNLNEDAITYEEINKLKLTEMVLYETMRLWPPSPHAGNRKCNKPFVFENEDGETVKINPGDNIYYPVIALHYDEKYWPSPKKFNPHRFSDENKLNIHPATYLPFGIGPRSCPGQKYAMVQMKVLLFEFLSKFRFQVCKKTPEKIEFECVFPVHFKKPVHVEVVPREY